jgi:hypothetical protein
VIKADSYFSNIEGLADLVADAVIALNFAPIYKGRHLVHVRQTLVVQGCLVNLDVENFTDEVGVQAYDLKP